jgi:superfamily II RNA helicase
MTELSQYLNIVDINEKITSTIENPAISYPFSLDPFQEHAISAIHKHENVLVCAKTGSGKTLVGEYQIAHSLKKGKRVFYTTPIKSLSNQKFHDLKQMFPSVGIMTGDIKFCPDAQIVIMTTEILRNLLYKKGTMTENIGLTASLSLENLDSVIFDECHYINDRDRGKVWEETMILLPTEVNLILLSATLDHPELFASWLGDLKQKTVHLIQTQYRVVPLVHTLLCGNQFKVLMDEKEQYNDKIYTDWTRDRSKMLKDRDTFKEHVKDVRQQGYEGAVDGKVHIHSFIHQMNDTITLLYQRELLPALFFVLSRKDCEKYASKVDGSLLSTSDAAAVNHIIGFHLSRYRDSLQNVAQYHTLCDLLKRGIAYHHSGLLPLMKEIVEILFSKGYVKVLFCTETFAVGLNMPTKTVVFVGLQKYDDYSGGMRILRTDEYMQMAGRAGRRGKDKQGQVIYLPDRQPIDASQMKTMMKGNKQPIVSRMDFDYDFILKTLQNNNVQWLQIMERSYWFVERQRILKQSENEKDAIEHKIKSIEMDDTIYADLQQRADLEIQVKSTVNALKKEAQKKLDSWKNKHMGPKWETLWKQFQTVYSLKNSLASIQTDIDYLKNHTQTIQPKIQQLQKYGFITEDAPIQTPELLKKEHLTMKGIIATEINEGDSLLLSEMFMSKIAHDCDGKELICILSAFLENISHNDEAKITLSTLSKDIPNRIKQTYAWLEKTMHSSELFDKRSEYAVCVDWIEPIWRWIHGENIDIISNEYDIFEGNFMRGIMKLVNIVDEWISIATICNDTTQIEKINEVRGLLMRDVIVSDSLYLRL